MHGILCHHLPHLLVFLNFLSLSFWWKIVGERVNRKQWSEWGNVSNFPPSKESHFLALPSSVYYKHSFKIKRKKVKEVLNIFFFIFPLPYH